MNLFELVFKQMRQRALSTWLTTLSVLLGVALAIAILIVWRGSEKLFGQTDFGYDVIIGAPKGSPLELTLNTIYHVGASPGNIPYTLYEELMTAHDKRPLVRNAFPFVVGDSYRGQRIVGTLPKTFGYDDKGNLLPDVQTDIKKYDYRPGYVYELEPGGHMFAANKLQAVIGSDVTRLTDLKVGDIFQATHGFPGPKDVPDIHDEKWTVVGQLKPTHTAADRCVFIPLLSFYCIAEHGVGLMKQKEIRQEHGQLPASTEPAEVAPPPTPAAKPGEKEVEEPKHYTLDPVTGEINMQLPKEAWALSAILVKARSPVAAENLLYEFKVRDDATAANPADVMREFFGVFLKNGAMILFTIAILVTLVASVSILVSIYNSVTARMREIAILRALGATRNRILTLICVEAMLIGLIGGVGGVIAGHLVAAIGSVITNRVLGEGIDWLFAGWSEVLLESLYVVGVIAIAFLAGLVPALKAYRTPVATNLVAA